MIKRKRVGLMDLFPPETIILHRVSTEYLPFSMVLQNILCQADSGAPQATPNGTKTVQEKETQHNKKKKKNNNNNQNYHRTKNNIFQVHIIRCYKNQESIWSAVWQKYRNGYPNLIVK